MKTNIIAIDPCNLFLKLSRAGSIKVKDAFSVKIADVKFNINGDLTWLEGNAHKVFSSSDIKKFFNRKHLEVCENSGQLEILMWNDEKSE